MLLRGLVAPSRLRHPGGCAFTRRLSHVPPARLLRLPLAARAPPPARRRLLAPRSAVCRAALLCTKPAATTAVVNAAKAPPPAKWSPRWMWNSAVEIALHYWHGSKLLAADTRIASKLLVRLVTGHHLSRREHNLLVRVLADLGRVIPLSFFVLVPFMEFALPFALRLFPNLLPSTFEEKHQRDEKLKRSLQMRLEVAQVLNDTLESRAKQLQKAKLEKLKKQQLGEAEAEGEKERLQEFMGRLREGGRARSLEEMMEMMTYFKDHLTLDSLSRPQLVMMCQFMGMPHFAPDALLRFQLRQVLKRITADDKEILWEGVHTLTEKELREALRARGMPSVGLDPPQLREALGSWLEFSQRKTVPTALMVMANMYRFAAVRGHQEEGGQLLQGEASARPAAAAAATSALDLQGAQAALSSIPDEAVQSAISEQVEPTPAEALQALRREETLIEEENKLQDESPVPEGAAAAQAGPEQQVQASRAAAERAAAERLQAERVVDVAAGGEEAEAGGKEEGSKEESHLSREQLKDLAQAVETMSSVTALEMEREELEELEEERQAHKAEIEEAAAESRQIRILDKRVNQMIATLRHELENTDATITPHVHQLDLDGDGVLSREEILLAMESIDLKKRPDAKQFEELLLSLDPDKDGKIKVAELHQIIKSLEMRDDDDEENPHGHDKGKKEKEAAS